MNQKIPATADDHVLGYGFVAGFQYLSYGFSVIFQRGMRRYAWLPLVFSLLFFSGLVMVYISYVHVLLAWIFNQWLPSWLHWLEFVVYPLLFLALLLVFTYGFSMVANLLAAPFNTRLAERVLQRLGWVSPQLSITQVAQDGLRSIGRQLHLIAYYVGRSLLCLILFIIPLVHVVAGLVWLLFGAWMMGLQYADYTMDLHGVSVREMRRRLGRDKPLVWGFGLAVLLCTMLPIINILLMPAAVAGATRMCFDHFKDA